MNFQPLPSPFGNAAAQPRTSFGVTPPVQTRQPAGGLGTGVLSPTPPVGSRQPLISPGQPSPTFGAPRTPATKAPSFGPSIPTTPGVGGVPTAVVPPGQVTPPATTAQTGRSDPSTWDANPTINGVTFTGWSPQNHTNLTLQDLADPTKAGKYAVYEYLRGMGIQPTSSWAPAAATALNQRYGTNVYNAIDGETLGWGDEYTHSAPGNSFFWGSTTGDDNSAASPTAPTASPTATPALPGTQQDGNPITINNGGGMDPATLASILAMFGQQQAPAAAPVLYGQQTTAQAPQTNSAPQALQLLAQGWGGGGQDVDPMTQWLMNQAGSR